MSRFKVLPFLLIGSILSFLLISCGGGSKNDEPKFAAPVISASLLRETIYDNETTELSWQTENADKVVISHEIGEVALSGKTEVSGKESTTFIITATGKGGVKEFSITLNIIPYFAVELKANQIKGYAPLTVNFSPILKTQNATNRHYWDFEGNGGAVDGGVGDGANGFDQVVSLLTNRLRDYDVVGRDYAFTYNEPGTYTARLRVWDANDEQIEASVTIEVLNQAPIVTASTNKDNGEIPLTVTFNADATDNEGIDTYEWDFNNDGVYEESTTSKSIQHVYSEIGNFQAKVRVTDTQGVSTEVALPHIEIRARPEGSPSVTLNANPLNGKAPLTVFFNSTTSVPDGSAIAKREWDFKGDGNFQEVASSSTSFEYLSGGRYYPRLKVTTEKGGIAESVVEIQVNAKHELVIVENTFNPEAVAADTSSEATQEVAEVKNTGTIKTKLGGDGPITLYIENRSREIVRTLVPWEDRVTGDYEEIWDGKDDSGNILPPGDYYAILKYKVEAEEKILDLRDSTGGKIFYPATGGCRRGLSPCGSLIVPTSDPLEPFAGKPWIFIYDMPYVANMTSYMTIYTSNEVVNTFFQQVPQGAGVHEIVWNGEGTDGKILEKTSTKYLISLFGHTLADNVMYLDHEPKIKNMLVTPSIFFPANKTGASNQQSSITFDLDKNSDIVMFVSNAETGGEVMRKTFSDISAGEGVELTWDGKNTDNILLAPGSYRISIKARLNSNFESIPIHAMQRIQY